MRAVIQRVSEAKVSIDGEEISSIGPGFLILLGIESADTPSDIDWLCPKIAKTRIFSDDEGKMNRSIIDHSGEILVVSQFTLHASTKKGNRPSFLKAAPPSHSEPLYEAFCDRMEQEIDRSVARGVFGGDMKISLTNDGPVTILIDTQNRE